MKPRVTASHEEFGDTVRTLSSQTLTTSPTVTFTVEYDFDTPDMARRAAEAAYLEVLKQIDRVQSATADA